jgi:hypothetical protein
MSDRLDEEARADPKGAKAERLRKAAAAARKANGHAGETEEPQAAEPGPAGEQQQLFDDSLEDLGR